MNLMRKVLLVVTTIEKFLRVDDTKQCATAQSQSSENSFEEQNDEACEFE